MTNARRYESFCVEPSEKWMYAGNTSGQISVIDINSFSLAHDIQAHSGTIHSVSAHPTLPYLAAIGNDRCLSLWFIERSGQIRKFAHCSFRDIPCQNDDDDIAPIFSHSVALAFHNTERRLVTRTGNGGTMELEFDDSGNVNLLWALRLHGEWDVQMTRYVAGSNDILSAGRDACVVLVSNGRESKRWQFGNVVALD